MSTLKQQVARTRNFNKYRVLGISLDPKGLTEEEWNLFQSFKAELLHNWDKNTRKLDLFPKKKT